MEQEDKQPSSESPFFTSSPHFPQYCEKPPKPEDRAVVLSTPKTVLLTETQVQGDSEAIAKTGGR